MVTNFFLKFPSFPVLSFFKKNKNILVILFVYNAPLLFFFFLSFKVTMKLKSTL